MMDKSRMDASVENDEEEKPARKDAAKEPRQGRAGGGARAGAKSPHKAGGKAAATKPATKPAAKPSANVAGRPASAKPSKAAPIIRKKEFVERVLSQSGLSKAATKTCVDATLRVLADAIAAGEALSIARFGKTRVSRHTERAGADTYVLRFKPSTVKDDAKGVEDEDDDV